MLSLYEILKASKTGIAPDMWTALAGMNWGGKDSGAEVKELTGIPPLSFTADGKPLLDYLISGNMSQSGTPTPTTPIQPQECGERTGNLLNLNRTYSNSFTTDTTKWMNGAATVNNTGAVYAETEIIGDTIKVTSKSPGYGASFLIEASPNTTYTVSFETDKEASGSLGGISDRDINGTVISNSAMSGKSATFTTHDNCAFLNVCFRFPPADGTVTFSNIMLNSGSTPLPYEPYGIKIPISSGGENLFDKTANYDVGLTTYNYTISGLDPDKYYTCSTNFEKIRGVTTASVYFAGGNSGINGVWSDTPRTFKPDNNGEIIVYLRYVTADGAPPIIDDVMVGTIWVMVNEGSTSLPYSPYNRTTTPIYLGEVPTTRRIKKLVLDGTETYTYESAYTRFIMVIPNAKIEGVRLTQVYCTHYESIYDGRALVNVPDNSIYSSDAATNRFFIKTTSYTSAADFKDYLAQQYAAGTPVTVWYVLATETTGIVNEPLRKIGDYADTLSYEQAGVQIPTNRGNTVIDVETTLKPSEMYIKYQE